MHRPLYWLLVTDRDKPEGFQLRREPVVWLYFIGTSLWGLACVAFSQRILFSRPSESAIIEIIKWISDIAVAALPTVVLAIREADRAGDRYTFNQLLATATLGFFAAAFLGAALEFSLSFVGVHYFLGIPINKWR